MIAEPSRDAADVGTGVTYPIQPGKVQPPALRDETLARTRLLDWLDVKIHRRVVFVIADAGYGKTTLLADFSRRTRLRTIWYRLDEEDRDWVGFLAHLVAAGREHDPAFAPRTASILRSLEPGGPTREDAIETFIEELPAIARDGAALILDDFHLADEVGDIRTIAREIVARGPERLSIVFASRRPPSIPVSKLRSLGELAELGIADLRFSDTELEQLFRETYGRPLEPDVLIELARRTEGWAASLTLVQAALRERTPAETRSFVRGLSGARDELHDYLAEEVVGDLPSIQQQFLMRTSLLQRITPELAQVATGLDAVEVQSMITEAERLGLLGRRAKRRSSEQRYHPLVREFLEDRLRKDIGPAGIDELHVTVAKWAEPSDWRTAAYHWSSCRRGADVVRVLEANLEAIVGAGAFAAAADFYHSLELPAASAGIAVIESRRASRDGDVDRVMAHAKAAVSLDPNNEVVIANLIASNFIGGGLIEAWELADSLATTASSPLMRRVGNAAATLLRASIDGDLVDAAATFDKLAAESRAAAHGHYEGVSELNAAIALLPTGRFDEALAHANAAIDVLSATSSGAEMKSAAYAKAWALAYSGDLDAARDIAAQAGAGTRHSARIEYLVELADIEVQLGNMETARRLLDEVGESTTYAMGHQVALTEASLAIRMGDPAGAVRMLAAIDVAQPAAYPANAARVMAHRSYAAALANRAEASKEARAAWRFASRQRASVWEAMATLAGAIAEGTIGSAVLALPERLRCVLSLTAEAVAEHIDELGDEARSLVRDEAMRRRERWLPAVRASLRNASGRQLSARAKFLSEIGDRVDIPVLTRLGKAKSATSGDRYLGRDLARRLAPQIAIRDLGRVVISIGEREVGAQDVRRKVIALLCFLLTKPRFSATREEVMDAMWPEISPSAAINSLNQTVYFLRRVFEPEYSEDASAGYIRQDSDLLWLDTELVESASGRCVRLLGDYERDPSPAIALQLSELYVERFALDFMYEEWAGDFRDWLHVSCLRVIEGQIRRFLDAGEYDLGVGMARRALVTDPRNGELEASLLRLLRASGAHAAAAEQYTRYSGLLKQDFGVDAPPAHEV